MHATVDSSRAEVACLGRRRHVSRTEEIGPAVRNNLDVCRSGTDLLAAFDDSVPQSRDAFFKSREALEHGCVRAGGPIALGAIRCPHMLASINRD